MSEINQRLLKAARFFALAALFFIPISVALVNTFVALFALSVFANRNFWSSLAHLWQIPVVRAALLLFVAMWIAAAYSSAPVKQAFDFAIKYQKKLLLIPLLIWVFGQGPATHWIKPRWVLLTSWSLVLTLSCAYCLRAMLADTSVADAATVFTDRISQSVGVVLLFCVAIAWAPREQDQRLKIALIGIAMLAVIDVLFLINGRTGQVCLIAVSLWMLFRFAIGHPEINRIQRFGYVATGILLIAVLTTLAMQQKTSRIAAVENEISQGAETSSGQRLEFYSMSWKMIKQHPLFGTGMGSVGIEFDRAAAQYGTTLSGTMRNAHNEYLMMMIQMGVPGLLLFLWLLIAVYRSAGSLPPIDRELLQAYVIVFSVGCMPNAFLTDFNEGHVFVFLTGIFLAPLYGGQRSTQSLETQAISQV
jgi:O-antigen ligase